jgi:hypothetical protein
MLVKSLKQAATAYAACYILVSCLAYYSTLKWRQYVSPKCRLTFLEGVVFQKIQLISL